MLEDIKELERRRSSLERDVRRVDQLRQAETLPNFARRCARDNISITKSRLSGSKKLLKTAEDLQGLARHKSTLECDIRRIEELRLDIILIDQSRRDEAAAYSERHHAEGNASSSSGKRSRAKNNAPNSKEKASSSNTRHGSGLGDQESSSRDQEPGSRKRDMSVTDGDPSKIGPLAPRVCCPTAERSKGSRWPRNISQNGEQLLPGDSGHTWHDSDQLRPRL